MPTTFQDLLSPVFFINTSSTYGEHFFMFLGLSNCCGLWPKRNIEAFRSQIPSLRPIRCCGLWSQLIVAASGRKHKLVNDVLPGQWSLYFYCTPNGNRHWKYQIHRTSLCIKFSENTSLTLFSL